MMRRALLAVAGVHDVCLNRRVGSVGRIACDDGSFVEGPLARRVVAVAAVAAAAEHDGPLLLTGAVSRGNRAAIERAQAPGRRVGALDRERPRSVVLFHGG